MNRSSNATLKSILKSGTRTSGKARTVRFASVPTTGSLLQSKVKDIAARIIQRAWLAYINKMIFQLLKHAICAAEFFVTHEILKKVTPLEAKLLKDPTMKCKIRFRFRGETFPPFIVFKIFLHTEGHGYKYFSGKNVFRPSSEAAVDACKLMGEKKFHHVIMEDKRIFWNSKITDIRDVVTMQDYMQYRSFLDEAPASSGGRNNSWRKLNLENIPRSTLIYDIVHYSESGVISTRLRNKMKFLSRRPVTEEMHKHQLQIVSEIRSLPPLTTRPPYRPYKQQNQVKYLGRRSKQALKKVEKMRKAYLAKEKNTSEEPKMDTSGAKDNFHFHFSF
ncbi:uncharacterized protein CXorf58 homolog isoform X2 [Saimiri boliviensis]|uniref:uncharacterized protein CXorf58 homolog isoform X2 n=1 Tax=Saimiri boliviensis TaxID=27679 RepID=UPI003D784DCE